MIYLIINIILFVLALVSSERLKVRNFLYIFVLTFLFLFSAFRFEVGCDWYGYLYQFRLTESNPEVADDVSREFIWWKILRYLSENNLPYPIINVISSAVFFFGIHALAKRQPNRLTFLVLLFPILIINMPMSGIRQGAAIGLFCFAIIAFIEVKPIRFVFWILIASGFHSSALIFIFLLPLISKNYSKFRLFVAAILGAPGLYFIASGSSADLAVTRYIIADIDAVGAIFRTGLLTFTGLYFLFVLNRTWRTQFLMEYPIIHIFSLMMISLILLLPISTVIPDRLGYYLIPAQAIIFSRIPYLNIKSRQLNSILPYIFLTLIFGYWVLNSSLFQVCYQPYQSWLFGFPDFSKYNY